MVTEPQEAESLIPDHTLGDFHAFDDPIQDRLLGLILALGAEVWVLRDRLHVLESVLTDVGIDAGRRIDEVAAQEERLDEMRRDRAAFMARFLRAVRNEGAGEPLSRVEPFRGTAI